MLTLPLSFVLAHFVGDFLFQSDWMATNKSKHWDVLCVHVACYTAAFSWVLWTYGVTPWTTLFLAATMMTHFVTDAITSRITSALWFFEPRGQDKGTALFAVVPGVRHWFFVMIGFDQLIHYVTLALTARWLLG